MKKDNNNSLWQKEKLLNQPRASISDCLRADGNDGNTKTDRLNKISGREDDDGKEETRCWTYQNLK